MNINATSCNWKSGTYLQYNQLCKRIALMLIHRICTNADSESCLSFTVLFWVIILWEWRSRQRDSTPSSTLHRWNLSTELPFLIVLRSHYARRKLTTQQSRESFGFVFASTQSGKDHMIIVVTSFSRKAPFQNVFLLFSQYTKTQSRVIKIPLVWRAFSAAPFLWRISVDGRQP